MSGEQTSFSTDAASLHYLCSAEGREIFSRHIAEFEADYEDTARKARSVVKQIAQIDERSYHSSEDMSESETSEQKAAADMPDVQAQEEAIVHLGNYYDYLRDPNVNGRTFFAAFTVNTEGPGVQPLVDDATHSYFLYGLKAIAHKNGLISEDRRADDIGQLLEITNLHRATFDHIDGITSTVFYTANNINLKS